MPKNKISIFNKPKKPWQIGELAVPVYINEWSLKKDGPPWIIIKINNKNPKDQTLTCLGKGGITRTLASWQICRIEDYPTNWNGNDL